MRPRCSIGGPIFKGPRPLAAALDAAFRCSKKMAPARMSEAIRGFHRPGLLLAPVVLTRKACSAKKETAPSEGTRQGRQPWGFAPDARGSWEVGSTDSTPA
jgi:hypothetical protein